MDMFICIVLCCVVVWCGMLYGIGIAGRGTEKMEIK